MSSDILLALGWLLLGIGGSFISFEAGVICVGISQMWVATYEIKRKIEGKS